jgi:hypothetical protein
MLSKYHSYLEAIADKESMEAETEREVTPAALIENP